MYNQTMGRFEPSNLSPLPRQPAACALPYGLTWAEMQPALPGFDLRACARARAFASHDKQGLNGGENSCILTLSYPVGRQQVQRATIFIKHAPDPAKAEAQKYRFLASQGVATPRLLAAYEKEAGEVILLEFLPTIGIDFACAGEVDCLLQLTADLNAIRNPPEMLHALPGLPQDEFDGLVRSALAALEGGPVRPKVDAARWFAAYQAALEAAQAMPPALNHNEFYFQQVGWAQRGPARNLTLFDFETLALAPRFTDIAGILYPLALYSGRDQAGLFQVYLRQLARRIPFELSLAEALRELRFTRIKGVCESLPWLVHAAGQPGAHDLQDALAQNIDCMWADLGSLGL